MFLGFSAFTWFHTILSLVMLVAGVVVMLGLIGARRRDGWTALFLITGVLTSATGFGFPFDTLLPSHWVGIISLVVLAVAIVARYVFYLAGAWRWVFAVTAMLAFYLDVFVFVVQVFRKVPALAPLETQPPFAITQGLLLAVFAVLTILAAVKFRPPQAA